MRSTVALAAIAAACALAVPAFAACSTSDIDILQTTLVGRGSRGQYPNVVGELRNNCAEAVSVELMATFRDAQGKVVSASPFWPAGMDKVPAGARWPIDQPGEVDSKPASVELRVVNVGNR